MKSLGWFLWLFHHWEAAFRLGSGHGHSVCTASLPGPAAGSSGSWHTKEEAQAHCWQCRCPCCWAASLRLGGVDVEQRPQDLFLAQISLVVWIWPACEHCLATWFSPVGSDAEGDRAQQPWPLLSEASSWNTERMPRTVKTFQKLKTTASCVWPLCSQSWPVWFKIQSKKEQLLPDGTKRLRHYTEVQKKKENPTPASSGFLTTAWWVRWPIHTRKWFFFPSPCCLSPGLHRKLLGFSLLLLLLLMGSSCGSERS